MFSIFSIILPAFYFNNALGQARQLCGLKEFDCFERSVKYRVYPLFVAGIPGVDPSDPMRVADISINLPDIKYELHNAILTGLKECKFEKLNTTRLSQKDTLVDYEMLCPRLSIVADYKVGGQMGEITVEGKGHLKADYENFLLKIDGMHEKNKDAKGDTHINILKIKVDTDLKGDVTTDYTGLIITDEEANGGAILEELFRDQVMDVFMTKFMDNLKEFMRIIPIKDLHYKNVQ